MAGTEELVPHLQEDCLGYLRVQSSSGIVASAHINHGQEAVATSSLIVYSESVLRFHVEAAFGINIFDTKSCYKLSLSCLKLSEFFISGIIDCFEGGISCVRIN